MSEAPGRKHWKVFLPFCTVLTIAVVVALSWMCLPVVRHCRVVKLHEHVPGVSTRMTMEFSMLAPFHDEAQGGCST